MTRKLINKCSLGLGFPFIAILILLIAVAALAQGTGAGQTPRKAYVAPRAPDVNAPFQELEHRVLPVGSDAERPPVSRLLAMPHGAGPMDENSPLFSPAVTYNSGGAEGLSAVVADVNHDSRPM